FPKVEGTLSHVERATGSVNLGGANGLVKGMVLVVYRPGEPFYQPITKEEMGRFEENIGFIELTTVGESESQGPVLVHQGKEARQGDRVRISAARIPILVAGAREKNNLVLIDTFSRFLLETDRFLIPSFPKMTDEALRSTENEPIYEFKVKSLPNQTVQIELFNRPFNHLIEQLSGTAGKFQE
ncbi:MAG: hypothetical protein ACYDBV_10035, partial [Nitrospiria bacterium]